MYQLCTYSGLLVRDITKNFQDFAYGFVCLVAKTNAPPTMPRIAPMKYPPMPTKLTNEKAMMTIAQILL
jgi:hypothetical protein